MQLAIALIGVLAFTELLLIWVLYYRMRAAESFLMILSGVVLHEQAMENLTNYIKSRSDHPAGKRRGDNAIQDPPK